MSDRDEFEAWMRETYGDFADLHETNGIYSCPYTIAIYTGWQAARRWRPIEEAPKDGSRILVLAEWTHGSMPYIARWSDGAEFERFEREPGWQVFECEDGFYSFSIRPEKVKRWQPLPEPPNE